MTHITENCIAFLGGTCADTNWRDELIALLPDKTLVFNPVVENWTTECQLVEDQMKEKLPIHVFVFTPQMQGMYAIAETTVSSMNRDKIVVFCILGTDSSNRNKWWTREQLFSWGVVAKLWAKLGAFQVDSLKEVSEFIMSNKDEL